MNGCEADDEGAYLLGAVRLGSDRPSVFAPALCSSKGACLASRPLSVTETAAF